MRISIESIPNDYYDIKKVDQRLTGSVIKPSHIFCDVGGWVGIDAITFSFAAKFGICLDKNKIALQNGKKIVAALQIQNKIDFMRASATDLPFRNNVLDFVTSFSVIDHLHNKKAVLQATRELSRIIKPLGYVIVTVPNKLFCLGTILMKIKKAVQPESFFERRFTPKELGQFFLSSGLNIVKYDSKYPTTIGKNVLEHNLPKIFQKIPKKILRQTLSVIEKTFTFIEAFLPLTLLGARLGCLGQKFLAIDRELIRTENSL